MRRDDPSSPRLVSLLLAGLGALVLLTGGPATTATSISAAVSAETNPEAATPTHAVVDRRRVDAERRTPPRAGYRLVPAVRRDVRRAAVAIARVVVAWRAGPRRGPPAIPIV